MSRSRPDICEAALRFIEAEQIFEWADRRLGYSEEAGIGSLERPRTW